MVRACVQSTVGREHLSADELAQLMQRQTHQLLQLIAENEQLAVSVHHRSMLCQLLHHSGKAAQMLHLMEFKIEIQTFSVCVSTAVQSEALQSNLPAAIVSAIQYAFL